MEEFMRCYEKVYPQMYRTAWLYLQNQQEAEDAVSEAVVAAYENIGKLRNSEAFKSWIFTIVSNICKKRLKKETVWRSYFGEEEYMQAAYEEPDIGLAVDVRKAFFLLEEEEQTIVGLSVFGGYNSNEIGTMMKLNANTVRSKRSRALQKMECVLR